VTHPVRSHREHRAGTQRWGPARVLATVEAVHSGQNGRERCTVRDIEDIDRDTLEKAAREGFERPANAAFWDDRCYTTHVPVLSWADRSDDVLDESNYHTALAMLAGAVAHDESGASEERGDDFHDGSSSHWLVGSLRQIWVRVYVSDEWEHQESDAREFTPAFIEAVRIALSLQDYPILDESDYSEREYAAWEAVTDDALDTAARDHVDSDTERALFYWLVTAVEPYRDELHECGFPDPDWDRVAELYATARGDHFEWLAARHLPHTRGADITWLPLPGQEPIPGLALV
jgi:hypothetical protein